MSLAHQQRSAREDRPHRWRRSLAGAVALATALTGAAGIAGPASAAAPRSGAQAAAQAGAAATVGHTAALPDLTSANRRAPQAGLPDWSKAGYRGGAALPGSGEANPDQNCHITAAELASQYGVKADGSDATTGLQQAIDAIRTTCTPSAGYTKLSSITLPAGRIVVTRQLALDADYMVLRGAGMGQTTLTFRPDANTRYDTLTADGSDWDEDGMTHGAGKGGWEWPGRGMLRVQTREVSPKYASDYASAPANRKDIFEGSVNQHWASGVALREGSAIGTTQIKLATNADMSRFKAGGYLWVGAANTAKFYQSQTVTDSSKYVNLHMRQQIFQIASVDTAGKNLTIDKPLEYDLPLNSTGDGSAAIDGTVYPSRVTPLKVVQGVGIEDLSITQELNGMPKLGGGTYNVTPADAKANFGNIAPEYQQHGIVLKWAANVWIRRVGTSMTGSHAVVTESAKNVQVQESSFDGSWNKGKGGNGYFRGSRVWDSLYAYNTSRNLRHFTFQWSASDNVAVGNDFDSDMNLHGGWERRNLFENNRSAVAFENSSKSCRANCGEEGGDAPDDSTWWPIWWGAGPKAVKWSGATGPQNVFYGNDMSKQTTAGGAYQPYYPDKQRLYQLGSSAADAASYQHLSENGSTILDWAGKENLDYTKAPNAGVNASRTDTTGSLFLKSSGTPPTGDTEAPSTPGTPSASATTASSVSLAWTAATDNVGVTAYDVYRDGALVGTSGTTAYTDGGLTASTSYRYTVKARDAAGNASATSGTLTVSTQSGGGTPTPTLISRGKPATASSVEGSGYAAGLAVDGSATTRWASAEGVDPQWIRIDLGARYAVSRVKLNWEAAYGKTYRIQTSDDGTTWTDIQSTTAGDGGTDDLTVNGTGRYIRMYGTARGTSYGYSLFEFEVYGVPAGGGGGDTTPPSTPAGLRTTATTSTSATLAWTAATDDVGVTGYDVYRGGTLVGTAPGTSYTDSGLTASTTYSYTVKARDAAGNVSAASSPLSVTTPGGGGGGPAVPFGGHTRPYVSGILKPTGAQATLDQKVVDYYNNWKSAFVRQNCGNGWYQVISPDADHPYVAEAQGYGMVIAATMAGADPDAKKIFDGLTKWMIDHPSSINPDLLAAEQDTACKSVNGSDGATDGDMDVAYGLLLADKQWGSAGTYNYKALALKHIAAIKKDEINPSTNLLKLGDWSSSGDQYYYITRTSDWMVDHFRAFRTASGDAAWDTIRTAHQTQITNLQNSYAPNTGLLPDFVVNTNSTPKPAPGQVLEDPNDGAYWWNACRTPWRIADDAVTSGDAKSLASARKLNSWIKTKTGGDPNKIAIGYKLDGTQLSSGSEAAFFAPFALTAMTDPGSQAWLDALWTKMLATPIDTSSYYSASIQLQVMITASGNHWVP
ncbi:glycosyl hydrolase family 8 [Streptomyces sp. NPDC090025]|uniref:glycosyl hydrolase family 8 n=1 Tax=Streptomyces sp. NPDC090025 TaxID=3365922 RepID=UPI003834C013